MVTTILKTLKEQLGITETTIFDVQLLLYANSIKEMLLQLGVFPEPEINSIITEDTSWEDLGLNNSLIKTYMGLRAKLLFDPPATSFLLKSLSDQITELETRISIRFS